MKRGKLYLLSMLVIFIYGCSKNPLSTPGILSFYSGSSVNSSQVSALKKVGNILFEEAYVYIKSIDVSTNGEEWINVYNGPMEVKITRAATIRIGSKIGLPEDEYHGVRIVIEPKARLLKNGSEILIEQLPYAITLCGGARGAGTNDYSPSDTITVTSSNGYLVPFSVKSDKETFLVFDMSCSSLSNDGAITNWWLTISVWATKYLG